MMAFLTELVVALHNGCQLEAADAALVISTINSLIILRFSASLGKGSLALNCCESRSHAILIPSLSNESILAESTVIPM